MDREIGSVLAAVIGGAAGAMVSLLGVWLDHLFQRRRSALRYRLEKLELIAELVDDVSNLFSTFPHRYFTLSAFEIGPVFRLQTVVRIYLPSARSAADALYHLAEDLAGDTWAAQVQFGGDSLGPIDDPEGLRHLQKIKLDWHEFRRDVEGHATNLRETVRAEIGRLT